MAQARAFAAFNVALGEKDGEATFYRSQSSPSSSLLRMGDAHKELYPHTSMVVPEKVSTRRLDSYADAIEVQGGLLLKIDVQGAEMGVLRGAPKLLRRADAVIAEVGYLGLYEGQSTIGEISGLLGEYGLTFMGFVDQKVRPADSLPVYGDVLFVRLRALRQASDLPGDAAR